MGYVDLIPDVFRLAMPDLATGKSYHTQKFNVGNKQCIGVTIKASQALSVAVAYGIATDTAAAAGVDIAASLPYKTSATSFASNTSTEGGTYHEIAVPPHARQAQLVISNASGSTVSGAVIDAALRVVAYPAASGSGSSDFASITGWPGSSSQFVHADGSYSPLSAAEITAAGGALSSELSTEASTRGSADTALAAPQYVTLATSGTLANERVLTGTSNQIALTDNGAGGTLVLSTPQNIHTGAAPTFAGETLTQALTMTGTQTALGASATGFYRDSSGNIWLCTPTLATGLALTGNGTQGMSITGAYGIGYTTTQSLFGGSTCGSYRDSSGNLNSNVATGATHIARVNGARVGGFPLVPGDMPALLTLSAPKVASQSCAAGDPFTWGTPTSNTAGFTYSSGTWTATVAGWYVIVAHAYIGASAIRLAVKRNGTALNPGPEAIAGYICEIIYLGVGETFAICLAAGYSGTPDPTYTSMVATMVGR